MDVNRLNVSVQTDMGNKVEEGLGRGKAAVTICESVDSCVAAVCPLGCKVIMRGCVSL